MSDLPRLTAEQTAERLGVKLETLYAYVARGRLSRVRSADGSTFDPLEVERFASLRRRAGRPGPRARADSEGRPLMVIETTFAAHRGRRAVLPRPRQLADLAQATVRSGRPLGAAPARGMEPAGHVRRRRRTPGRPCARGVADARDGRALPAAATHRDRQQVAVTAFAAADPLRYSLEPDSRRERSGGAGRRNGGRPSRRARGVRRAAATAIADRLWAAADESTTARRRRARPRLNAALVLLLDHDIAVSTLAARAAASARANPYAVVTAGLGALDSPLHGNASRAAHRMLERVVRGDDPGRVVADTVVTGRGPVPGLRSAALLRRATRGRPSCSGCCPTTRRPPRVAEAVRRGGRRHPRAHGAHPNVDLALAALALASGMPDDAGEVIFATGADGRLDRARARRVRQPPLRLAPVGRPVGRVRRLTAGPTCQRRQRRSALRASQLPRNCAACTSTTIVITATQVTTQL